MNPINETGLCLLIAIFLPLCFAFGLAFGHFLVSYVRWRLTGRAL
jgi:hypothetical protein